MKVYFLETDDYNAVAITDGHSVKLFSGEPDGIFEGVDLYGPSSKQELSKLFGKAGQMGNLNSFEEMFSPEEMPFAELEDELAEFGTLVFQEENKQLEKVEKRQTHIPSPRF